MCLPDISIKNFNDIEITYKLYKGLDNTTKIFGKHFVNNNTNKCKIIYNNKKYELTEYFGDYFNQNNENEIRLILRMTIDVFDMSYMFYDCRSLISISDLDKKPNLINDKEMNLENNSSGSLDFNLSEISIKNSEEEPEEDDINSNKIFETFSNKNIILDI